MKIVIFVPTYNERENVQILISEIIRLNPDYHVLVVDDASDDGTAQVLDKIAGANPKVLVLHRTGKRGRGIAGIDGFKRCLLEKPDYVVEMDADLSHDPKYIPEFLKEMDGYDVVIGSRFIAGSSILGRSGFRNYLSYLAQFFSRAILGLKISDATSGYRCFKRYVLEGMDWDSFIAVGPEIVGELNYHIQRKGFRVKEMPIVFRPRIHGRSKLNLEKLFEVFCALIRLRLS